MKNFVNVLLSALVAVLFIGIIGFGVTSCHEGGIKGYFLQEESSSETAYQAVEDLVNPSLGCVKDVVDFHSTLTSNMEIDSIFMALPETVIIDVSSVLLKKMSPITKKDIVDEYNRNRAIYDNLPKDATVPNDPPAEKPIVEVSLVKEGTTTVTEAPPTRVGESSYKDTVIDGKQAIIKQ